MSEEALPPNACQSAKRSAEERARLHERLDELLALQDEIAEVLVRSDLSQEQANRLKPLARDLVIRANRFAAEVAGGEARAVAYSHPEPTSREALSLFLKSVAENAAPYAYATLNLGISTFTRTDLIAFLDALRSLDHGDVPAVLRPADKVKLEEQSTIS